MNGSAVDRAELQELANAFGGRLARLFRLLVKETGGGSRTQLSVLATLRDSGPCRITELAEAEHVAQPTMTVLVSRLEREGWVERTANAADRRVVDVAITAAGRAALARLTAARAAALEARLAALTPAERAVLGAALPVLDKLIDHEGTKE